MARRRSRVTISCSARWKSRPVSPATLTLQPFVLTAYAWLIWLGRRLQSLSVTVVQDSPSWYVEERIANKLQQSTTHWWASVVMCTHARSRRWTSSCDAIGIHMSTISKLAVSVDMASVRDVDWQCAASVDGGSLFRDSTNDVIARQLSRLMPLRCGWKYCRLRCAPGLVCAIAPRYQNIVRCSISLGNI